MRGLDGIICCLHTSTNIALNARFTFSTFTLAPEDPRSTGVLQVAGSHLTEAFIIVRTSVDGASTVVRVQYGRRKLTKAWVQVEVAGSKIVDVSIGDKEGVLRVGDVCVEVQARGAGSVVVKVRAVSRV